MKLPVANTLGNREASLDKDALMRNALAEPEGEIVRARKRPALVSAYTVTSGTGQALFTWTTPGALGPAETLVSIVGDTINTAPSPVNSYLSFTVEPS